LAGSGCQFSGANRIELSVKIPFVFIRGSYSKQEMAHGHCVSHFRGQLPKILDPSNYFEQLSA